MEETLAAKQQALNFRTTKFTQGFLVFDLDILGTVGEQLSELNLDLQYSLYCETWYRSILMTKKIRQDNLQDQKELVLKFERIGSNCINLLASFPRCDLTYRDFTDCAIPHAYLYKRNLKGCKYLKLCCKISSKKFFFKDLIHPF